MWRRGGIAVIAAMTLGAAPASAEPLVGAVGGALVTFDSAAPGGYTSLAGLSGLAGGAGEQVAGIDFRANPIGVTDVEAAKQLYLVTVVDGGATDTLRVYTVDPGTATATLVGTALTVTGGDAYGVDFNHTVDRIRVVNGGDENLRINPNNGARADAPANDADLTPVGRGVVAAAYDRVDTDMATGTTLYGLTASELVTIGGLNSTPSPNLGVVNTVGATGAGPFAGNADFDISPSGTGFAAGVGSLGVPTLYRVDLTSGALTAVGRTPTTLSGLAVVPASTVAFSAPTYSVGEAGGAATITVNRSGATNRTSTVSYSAGDTSGVLTFAPGETSKTFSVPVANDAVDAPDRVITLRLSGDALTSVGATSALTIVDDEAAPDRTAPGVSVTAARSVKLAAFLRGLKVTLRPNEAARLEVTLVGTLKGGRAFNLALAAKTLALGGGTRSTTLKAPKKLVGSPRKSFKVQVRVVATDAAGNRSTATRTVTVKP